MWDLDAVGSWSSDDSILMSAPVLSDIEGTESLRS